MSKSIGKVIKTDEILGLMPIVCRLFCSFQPPRPTFSTSVFSGRHPLFSAWDILHAERASAAN